MYTLILRLYLLKYGIKSQKENCGDFLLTISTKTILMDTFLLNLINTKKKLSYQSFRIKSSHAYIWGNENQFKKNDLYLLLRSSKLFSNHENHSIKLFMYHS